VDVVLDDKLDDLSEGGTALDRDGRADTAHLSGEEGLHGLVEEAELGDSEAAEVAGGHVGEELAALLVDDGERSHVLVTEETEGIEGAHVGSDGLSLLLTELELSEGLTETMRKTSKIEIRKATLPAASLKEEMFWKRNLATSD